MARACTLNEPNIVATMGYLYGLFPPGKRDPDLRRQMGRRARESAISRYSTDKIIPQYIEFYERILQAALP